MAKDQDSGAKDEPNSEESEEDEEPEETQTEVMEVTPMHPIYVEGEGWLNAENLEAGDRLRLADGGMAKVLAIEHQQLSTPAVVYNFTVATFHTYFVLDPQILVHNVSKKTCSIRNEDLAGQNHPVTGVPFDDEGHPIFSPVFDTNDYKVNVQWYRTSNTHKFQATRLLKGLIEKGDFDASIFTPEQLDDIMSVRKTIRGYIWHHHQDLGRMQLVDE